MRVAVLIISPKNGKTKLDIFASELAKGMEAAGHQVDLLNAKDGIGSRLPGYDYIALCTQTASAFSSKLSPLVARTLASPSSLVGKRSAAFLIKKGLFLTKALALVMKAMEKEGMAVNWSDFLFSADQALALGKSLDF